MEHFNPNKKRIRRDFSRLADVLDMPYLLEMQRASYKRFTHSQDMPKGAQDIGLDAVLSSCFPVKSRNENVTLEYMSYTLEEPKLGIEECRLRGTTYASPLRIKLRMVVYNKSSAKEIVQDLPGNEEILGLSSSLGAAGKQDKVVEENIYIGDIPLMTEQGSFIINGTDRLVVSQLHRSPGVVFDYDKSNSTTGKILYSAHIIPYTGVWVDIEFGNRDQIFVRLDRRKKFPVTWLLFALGLSLEDIFTEFHELNTFTRKGKIPAGHFLMEFQPHQLRGEKLPVPLKGANGKTLVKKDTQITKDIVKLLETKEVNTAVVPADFLMGRYTVTTIVDESTGEILVPAGHEISENNIEEIVAAKIETIKTVHVNIRDAGPYLINTLALDDHKNKEGALQEIYHVMRPGEPFKQGTENTFFEDLFFNEGSYNLSDVGRVKLNRRLDLNEECTTLTKADFVAVLKELLKIKNGKSIIDDVDHLGNRRIRSVGEMVANHLRLGLIRVERAIKDKLGMAITDPTMTPTKLFNAKPVGASIMELFNSSQLCQFLDQNNPLAEITHKRRVSVLGPGGLARDRAGFEVRDIHPTHYGRLCPIETPEGQNIGLISSLASFARIDQYGFIEAPYRKVEDKQVKGQVDYLSAINESNYIIAQASAALDAKNRFKQEQVEVRYRGSFHMKDSNEVGYMDVSPRQIVSVAASLIPFLEHDDANRALMGSNMQRQAVPTLHAAAPIVGTNMEHLVARDSGVCQVAARAGVVESVEAHRIVVRIHQDTVSEDESGVDIYNLIKYQRSNQNTCINQRPRVTKGDKVAPGDIIADGTSIDRGELSLGQNVRVAFMPWHGYNFEDSILVSENLVKEDKFTSVHIQELVCTARENDIGEDSVTEDVPYINEEARSKLDSSGIVYVGAEVKEGDILVGKVTPKGDIQLAPEEKLLAAVFGEKSLNVKNTSLRVPSGMEGVVIDVQVLTRHGFDKDERATDIEEVRYDKFRKDREDEVRIRREDLLRRLRTQLVGKKAISGHSTITKAKVLTEKVLAKISDSEILDLELEDLSLTQQINETKLRVEKLVSDGKEQNKREREQINYGYDLAPGVIKMVKIYLAVKRRIQPGDKMAGRHGNKGVISAIMPEEDMPYDENGVPVDIVLNPLGVPSRMNVGQVLELHLGLAGWALGEKISQAIRDKNTAKELRELLEEIYNKGGTNLTDFKDFSDEDIIEFAKDASKGVYMSTPVFDGATEDEIRRLLKLSGYSEDGQLTLYDGRTGEPFDRRVSVGYMYMLKLNHLVDDKMHARSTGTYGLVNQQPLGGKAQFGGQRLGEMEVWALEAYGAAYVLHEMLTVKSDDMEGRQKIYSTIVKNGAQFLFSSMEQKGFPEAYNVLSKEFNALAINMEMN